MNYFVSLISFFVYFQARDARYGASRAISLLTKSINGDTISLINEKDNR